MKHFTPETFLDYRFPSSPLISPDGKLTAFVLRQADLEKNSYPGDIWVLENETGVLVTRHRIGNATFWCKFPEDESGYTVVRAYSHRMTIETR